MSASPPTPDLSLQGNEPTLRATFGHRAEWRSYPEKYLPNAERNVGTPGYAPKMLIKFQPNF